MSRSFENYVKKLRGLRALFSIVEAIEGKQAL